MRRKIWIICINVFISASILFAGQHATFCAGTIDKKVEGLLSKMTLEEKIGQMTQVSSVQAEYKALIKQGHVGSLLNVKGAEAVNAVQKIAVEESRLGIPLIFGLDVIHGYRTIFPICLGEAATWDPALVEKSARIAAKEASAAGINWTFGPMVDIARDARWGRIAEGSGEDPYLGSVMAAARVRGFQGKCLSEPNTIVACAKHYVAYGGAIAGKDYNTVDISVKTLREIYLPPFKAAVDAEVGTFMCAFNDLNGVPCSANRFILTDILRHEWGFNGFLVSDWASIEELMNHGIAATSEEAGKMALEAGVDMEMVSETYRNNFAKMVKEGNISEELINESVRRILRIKLKLGLFDRPYADPKRERSEILTKENLRFARKLAARSIVLLKNANNLLPLKKNIKTIALIGPLAKDQRSPLGWWSCDGRAEDVVPIFKGIKDNLSSKSILKYAKGCEIKGENTDGFEEAAKIAKEADVAILVVGESDSMSGEGASRAHIDLPGKQLELIKAIYKTKTPIVVVLMNGRPLAIPWIAQHVPAIVETWQLGVQCGNAIADVLFGDVNPGGKLPVTFPRTVGQVPIYYNHKSTGRPTTESRWTSRYLDTPVGPLYPFGFGLSYTKFDYRNLKVSADKIRPFGKITVSAEIINVGDVAGDEIVQLYIQDVTASMTRAVKELKGFQRITLTPGEKKKVEFTLGPKHLGFYNRYMEYVVEPGIFKIWIGPNSVEGLEGSFEVVE